MVRIVLESCELDIDDVAPAPTSVEHSSRVISHRLLYATHNADHVHLNPAQRLSVQHLREQLLRLLRKRDTYREFVGSLPASPIGVGKRPNYHQQDIAYELIQGFFEQVYATLSALASVHGRIRLYPEISEAPINSNDKFLSWWQLVGNEGWLSEPIDILKQARDFRTVFMHPQMWPLFDWRTVGSRDDVYLILFGSASSRGNVPPGSTRAPEGDTWEFEAPEMDASLWAFEQLCMASFGPIYSWYEDEYGAATCTWEPDGIGSSIGDHSAKVLREALAPENVDPSVRAKLAPGLIDELDHYIDAMANIRALAKEIPRPSAIRSNIPAARAISGHVPTLLRTPEVTTPTT